MRSFKYKLRPTKTIEDKCYSTLNICRELYNAAIQERKEAYKTNRVSINYHQQCLQLPEIKESRAEVNLIHSQVLQATLRKVSQSFDNFFRRVKNGEKPGYPRYKSAKRYNSFTYPQGGFSLKGNKLSLSKIGSMRLHLSRPIEGKIKTCTIKHQPDGWYVIFACEVENKPLPPTGKAIGLDLNIENFCTLSNGEVIENARLLKKAERALKKAQRKASRRKKGSNRRRKAVILLAKKYLALSRQRLDFFHKLALYLVRQYDHIAIEDLNIKGLVKNHHLTKAIQDVAWNTFVQILIAKAENAGRVVVKVDPKFTSQDCSQCGNRVRKSLSEREHRCIACGLSISRDHNAALNILSKSNKGSDSAFGDEWGCSLR